MLVKTGRKPAPVKWLGWIECACVCCDPSYCLAMMGVWRWYRNRRGLAFLIVNQESSPMSRPVDTSSHQLPIATLFEALLAPFYKWGIWVSESFHTCSKLHCWVVTRTEFKRRKRRCREFASLNWAFCWDKHFIFPGHQASWAEHASSLQQWMTDSHSQMPQHGIAGGLSQTAPAHKALLPWLKSSGDYPWRITQCLKLCFTWTN